METILVTGGAGFIGSHLCERLRKEGKRVIVVDDFNNFYDPAVKRANADLLRMQGCTVHELDIRSPKLAELFAAEAITAVIHLAARAGVRPSLQDPMLYAQVNIAGTLNLLELCRKYGVQRFIFGSSSSVYGTNQKVPFSEADQTDHPMSPYAISKIAAEQYCKIYHQLFGLRITCLRFFTVYGPRGRPDMAVYKFTEAVREGGEILLFAGGKLKRDFTYVTDIVEGIVAALDRNHPFEIINLGNAHPISVQQLVNVIEQILGQKAKLQQAPAQPGDVPITYADIAKAKRLLDWEPKVGIEEGMKQFCDWFASR
ncbi:MAG TPA: NAD-dependent epimerase/dehydratase family protein [Candidatus Nanoarchaeia archaeon]|nr:NAD-dependent epimerase/dehydratase family protein [Candidatus Nanoarchaeia archaeon]